MFAGKHQHWSLFLIKLQTCEVVLMSLLLTLGDLKPK